MTRLKIFSALCLNLKDISCISRDMCLALTTGKFIQSLYLLHSLVCYPPFSPLPILCNIQTYNLKKNRLLNKYKVLYCFYNK